MPLYQVHFLLITLHKRGSYENTTGVEDDVFEHKF